MSEKVQLLTKPDGNVLQTVTDPRVIGAALGAVGSSAIEKLAFSQPALRKFVGFAQEKDGNLLILAPDKDGKPDATKGHQSNLFTQRQLVRLVGVGACVTGIEATSNGQLQYALMGAAVVLMARIVLDIVPGLQFPARQ
jgi:hypothetical protein